MESINVKKRLFQKVSRLFHNIKTRTDIYNLRHFSFHLDVYQQLVKEFIDIHTEERGININVQKLNVIPNLPNPQKTALMGTKLAH